MLVLAPCVYLPERSKRKRRAAEGHHQLTMSMQLAALCRLSLSFFFSSVSIVSETLSWVNPEEETGGRCLGRDGHVCSAHRQLGGARPLEHGATLHAGGHHPFAPSAGLLAGCSSPSPYQYGTTPLGVTVTAACKPLHWIALHLHRR